MMINKINANAISSYKAINKTKVSDSAALEKKASVAAGTFDMVEFDFEQSINSAKANIANSLNANADAAKISFLKSQYAAGTCPVSAEKIAKAMFEN